MRFLDYSTEFGQQLVTNIDLQISVAKISRRNYFYVFVTFKYQQTGATILLSMERTASTFQTETVSIDMAIPVYSVLQSNHISGEALQNHVQMNSI